MKSSVLKKISQALVSLMLISALVPVLAFAATGISGATYDGSSVSGSVYSDVYDQNGVLVDVYAPNGTKITSTTLTTYSVQDNVYTYTFKDLNVGAFKYVDVKVGDSVYKAVYDEIAPTWTNGTLSRADRTRTSITLSWTGITEPGVTYHVYQDNALLGTTTSVTYTATGLLIGKSYTFQVQAADAVGNISTNGPSGLFATLSNSDNSTSNGSSSGGGGGGSTASGSSITADANGKVDSNTLKNALSSNSNVEIKISGDSASLPASALADAVKAGKTITVVSANGSYVLPLSVLNVDALAKALGVSANDLNIVVSIKKLTGASATAVSDAASSIGATSSADAVDFNAVAEANGKTTAISFGKTYVSRSVTTSKAVDSSKATGVLYNETTKKLSFVPATFQANDGKTVATLKRNGNSIYTVVEVNKSFDDIASHWAKADIELLANKLVVDGVSDKKFDADRNITRAEFAALVVRALGLSSATASSSFKDVQSGAWYADAVATASAAGIINGYEDNTFRPDAQISREELAAMIIRALNYADISTNVSADDQAKVLGKFKDANKIVWAKAEIAAAINAGIINGMTDDTIGADGKASRAQSVTMLKRFLSTAKFIN